MRRKLLPGALACVLALLCACGGPGPGADTDGVYTPSAPSVPAGPSELQTPAPETPGLAQTPAPETPGLAQTPAPETPGPVQTPAPETPEPAQTPAPETPGPAQTPAPETPEPAQTPAPETPKPAQTPAPETPEPGGEEAGSQDVTAGEKLMETLKVGWNLGNTFDAPDGETAWGNPETTKELIGAVKDLGFGFIRIPVSWHKHLSQAPEYRMDAAWLDRVETVTDWALDAELYVILDAHHDCEVYYPFGENRENARTYLNAVWSQVAARFAGRDERLIFQTMNEPRLMGTGLEWNLDLQNRDCLTALEVINELNQTAVDAIRAAGGYNESRWIIVSPYAGKSAASLAEQFRLPDDPAGKLIVSAHEYIPYDLCLNVNSSVKEFTGRDEAEIEAFMEKLNRRFVSQGVPVIIDEMGAVDKGNGEARYAWAKYYVSRAKEYGIACCWWDNGSLHSGGEGFGLIDRRKLEVYEDSRRAWEGLMDGLKGEQ